MTQSKKRLFVLWGIFAVYSVLTFVGAVNHEMWLDEAQALTIVRDCPLSELPYRLTVEGHPPLWYLILLPFVRLGFPMEYMPLISWFFMAAGVWILLFKVRLSLPFKAAVIFSSGFLFYNSVILRSYCLIPPLLFLILWIYPSRRQHPVLYGLLIALLANTHLVISGVVGILGIFMIYDLFAEWKSSEKRENRGKLIGLIIAGIGVLVLVVPLLNSVNENSAVELNLSSLSLKTFLYLPSSVVNEVFEQAILLPVSSNVFWKIFTEILNFAFWITVIELRHWRRAFAAVLGFTVIFVFLCGYVWSTLPNRASVFLLVLAFVICLTQFEEPVFKKYKISDKITSPKLRALLEKLINADKKAKTICTVIIAVPLVLSVPSGIAALSYDISGNFSGSKELAEYISENFDKDTVFIGLSRSFPEISCYDPDVKIFNTDINGFASYVNWEYRCNPKEDTETVMQNLDNFDKLYVIAYGDSGYVGSDIYIYI